MELMLEAQAILPYMLAGPDGIPNRDIVVDCVFAEIPVELQQDVRQYHELAEQRRDLDRKLNELGARTVKQLRVAAGLTDEDSAAMLGISRQRANQLRNAS
jgi:DNA-binding XRE family transcriptional regulator